MGKYFAVGLYVMTENQIFSCLDPPNSVNKYFIFSILPLKIDFMLGTLSVFLEPEQETHNSPKENLFSH